MALIASSSADQTAAIQEAIDALAATGGGIVRLASGSHSATHLRLRTGTTLHFEDGASLSLTGSYEALADNRVTVIAEQSDRALIVAQGQQRIGLTGSGEILAPGPAFVIGDDPEVGTLVPAPRRPRVLVFEDCSEVTLSGIAVRHSPMWTLHLVACQGVTVRSVTIDNDRRLPNTDGIVIDSCADVSIEGVTISTADDGICLKTSRRGDVIGRMDRIAVRHCRVSSLSCALKIGTETFGDIDDVLFADCEVIDSNRALGVFSRDGGAISRVRFHRIAVDCRETPDGYWGSGEALTVTVLDRVASRPAGAVTSLEAIDISGRMEGAICLVAAQPGGISGVTLRNIALIQRPGDLRTGRQIDLRPTPAELAVAGGAKGRANAWQKDESGRIVGLTDYPGGLPALYSANVEGLDVSDLDFDRPAKLPEGWNDAAVVTEWSTP